MKEVPILFSAPMARAILAGTKTQTRRLLGHIPALGWPDDWAHQAGTPELARLIGDYRRFSPYGVAGARLWVREEHYRYGHWEPLDGPKKRTKKGRQRWRFVADRDEVLFEAPDTFRKGRHHKDPATPAWHKRLARFMPRALFRITLELTEVRLQRLQAITDDDARAEGVERDTAACDHTRISCEEIGCLGPTYRSSFCELWNRINGERAPWSSNPWVWAIAFQRVP